MSVLENFIAKELCAWSRAFPIEFYQQICRLKRWPPIYALKRPSLIGRCSNDVAYSRLAPGELEELKRRNPAVDKAGQCKHKHHPWLTPNVDHPALQRHIGGLIALMRIWKSWNLFKRKQENAYSKFGEASHLALDED